MNLIASVDENWGIGRENALLYHLPEDLKYFKEKTTGKVIICGKNTLLSFPGSRPLPNRVHLVLTHTDFPENEQMLVFHDTDSLLQKAASFPADDVFLAGGESVYRQLYKKCRFAYITKINSSAVPATAFLPDLDRDPDFRLLSQGERQVSQNGIAFCFCLYENLALS